MNITANNVASKLFVAFVASAMLFTLATPAKAATAEELQAQIDALMAQIAALKGDTATTPAATPKAGCTFTRPLTLGSEGADVKCLQDAMTPKYFTNAGGSTGYFGPVTKAAVAAWQTANGVMPAAGYFGPVSQAKFAAMAATDPDTDDSDDSDDEDTDSADLGDGEGSIKTFDEVSSADSNINEGETGEVMAFTAEIEGDVEINRVDVYLENTAAGSESDNADDYFQGASLLVDGEEVATLDVDAFDEDDYGVVDVVTGSGDEYRLRFSGLNLVFADGDEPEFTVAFEANTSIDTGDLTEDWGVALADDSVRFVDGEGFSDSDGDTAVEESFGFEEEEAAELKISESSDNPDASTLEVDDQDESDELAVFMFDVEEKNDVDVTVEDMRVTITTTGTADESAVVSEAKLYAGSEELASESVSNGGVVNFESLGLEIAAGDTAELTVKLVFNGSEDYNEGDSVVVAFTSITKAEDENGNDEGDMTINGSASSESHTLRSAGISVEVTEADTDVTAEDGATNDRVTFTWELDITAFGNEDVYINKDFADVVAHSASTSGDLDIVFLITPSAGANLTATSGTISSDADEVAGDDTAYGAAYNGENFYVIEGGDTETFTITVTGTNQTDAKQIQAALSNIEWTTDEVTSATAKNGSSTTINSYADNLLDDSETPFKSVN